MPWREPSVKKKPICTFATSLLALVCLACAPRSTPALGQVEAKKASVETLLKLFVDECLLISPGNESFPATFQFGGTSSGPFSLPARELKMSGEFRISKYEVTQELYEAIMGKNPSRWKGTRNSVETVSFQDAQQFCLQLTTMLQVKKLIKGNEQVRLPTEAEWEFCCRAGTSTPFSFGDSATAEGDQDNQATLLSQFGWHTGNAAGNDPVVGSLKPNPWGLYDMHGYLWEFVGDAYTAPGTVQENSHPEASSQSSQAARVIRGGSWRNHYSLLTSDSRMPIPDHAASDAIGFRCVIAR